LPLHSSYLPLGVPNGLVIHHAQGRLLLQPLHATTYFLAPSPSSRASPSPERSQPEGTAAGRGDPRASLPGLREEAGPPPPAPRGLRPAACADGGGGGGGRGGSGAAARIPSPQVRPRGTGRGVFSVRVPGVSS
jgi:hypothetical protein